MYLLKNVCCFHLPSLAHIFPFLFCLKLMLDWLVICFVLFCFFLFPSSQPMLITVFLIIFQSLFIFETERDTECKRGRGRDRETHRIQSRLQAPSCQHRAQRGADNHKPWDHDSWAEGGCWTDCATYVFPAPGSFLMVYPYPNLSLQKLFL